MEAVYCGSLACVKKMDMLEGTNFRTKNNAGETLVDVAREGNISEVVEYLLDWNKKVETLEDIAAYNVAIYIERERQVEDLEIALGLKTVVSKYLDI